MKMNELHNCVNKEDCKLYRIGLFAGVNRVTIKALRHYDEQGLLVPAYVDLESGYRYYTSSQIADLHQILALKNMGFSLEEIREIQNGKSEKELLRVKKAQILTEISELTAKLAQVESYLSDDKLDLSAHVLVKSLPEVTIASMQTTIEGYDALFDLMPQMGAEMEMTGCICVEPDYCFTHYLESGYSKEQICIETCQSVVRVEDDTDKLKFKVLSRVDQAACIFHKGSYDDFPQSYAKVLKFIEDNGYEICGNIRECYIDGVWNNESPKDWLSEIQIPVRKVHQSSS
ncbi:MAG TPA: MerR family transcriptional regulator [Lachnospiraceae bacterium]|nr:MerR family transcriptional regulator [Lachnospiraceae bacterium]